MFTSDTPMVVEFTASGHKFVCLNSGPAHQPNPSISFFYICETQGELNTIWKAMENGGKALMQLDKYPWSETYGWVQDQFGVSWQVISKILGELMSDPDSAERVAKAFSQMKKNSTYRN